jgi:protease-4
MAGNPSRFRSFFLGCFGAFFLITAAAVLIGYFYYDSVRLEDPFGEKIAVVEVSGIIEDSRDIVDQIKKYREDKEIKAVLVRIESPGGAVAPSQEIYREIRKTVPEKTVVSTMGTLAASGGYYIACAAHKVVANPGTVTGSIGVIMMFPNMEDLLGKIGLKEVVIKSGKYKDIGSPSRTMTEEEIGLLQETIDDVYRQFVQAIADGRGMEFDEVQKIADGRIFSGRQAKDLGLVDELGGFEDALDLAVSLAGIKGKPKIVQEKIRDRWWRDLLLGRVLGLFQDRLNFPMGLQYLWIGG